MTDNTCITISHFSDILCIWAYIAQVRIDELKREHASAVDLQYHFFPVFGSVESTLEKNWSQKGGVTAYNKHVISTVEKFSHIEVHPDLWLKNRPTTSLNCHLHFKAVQLLQSQNIIAATPDAQGNTPFESFVWQVRLAFFKQAQNISDSEILLQLCEQQGLPVDKIEAKVKSGEAFAALDGDTQLVEKFRISGSPTLVFNEGRQTIYGNVGYRVIEANIRELLNQPENQASWC